MTDAEKEKAPKHVTPDASYADVYTKFYMYNAKYRDYDREDTLGEYARVFEEEYEAVLADQLGQLDLDEGAEGYRKHVEAIPVRKTHEGYFSIDKKSGRSVDGKIAARGDFAGQSDDVDAYDLILRDKERLLSFEEPVRFIWSHSALREGWDNPNVFVMGYATHGRRPRRAKLVLVLSTAPSRICDVREDPHTQHTQQLRQKVMMANRALL